MLLRTLFFILLPIFGLAQNTIGLPDVINYNKEMYTAGLQNWDIRQDKNGTMYFANNEGLLSFNGKYWKINPLPNKTNVRSVEIGDDGKIYVGGQDELGYFAPTENGELKYFSLTKLIPEKDRAFADVWDIATFKNDIFFRTFNRIFKITNQTVSVYHAPNEWTYMGVCNGHLFAHDIINGLLTFENNIWSALKVPDNQLQHVEVTSILPVHTDSIVITTLKSGIFLLTKSGFSKIETSPALNFNKERIYAATAINNNWIALATTYSGIYIIDTKGQLIQSFSKTEGLQNNNILSIFLDRQSNLWLGLNNGIDFIAYNSAIKHITPNGLDGSGYTAVIHNNKLYTGTSSGLYSVPLLPGKDVSFSKGYFSPVQNAAGQNWNLTEINGQLLLGHHEGAFIIDDNFAKPLLNFTGFWNFVALSDVYPSKKIVAGNYRGLTFLNFNNNEFTTAISSSDFTETSRFVAIDQFDNIWVSHPYHGVYKVTAGPDGKYTTKLYTGKNGLPSTLNNHVYKVKGEVVVATEQGVFIYNASKDVFEPSDFYKKILGQQSLRYLKEDGYGNIWFMHEKTLGVIDMSTGKPAIIYIPELNNKMLSGFEFIYPVNEQNIFIGGEKGFFHINYEKYKKNVAALEVKISAVHIVNKVDSLLFGGYFNPVNEKQVQLENQIPKLANSWKTIHFEFASPLFGQQTNLEYSHRLKGFDENWSVWSGKFEKEYTNLPPGNYRFEVKVRNNLGNESTPVTYSFKILPPWYKTNWAYLIYFLLFCLGIYFLYKWQLKKFYLQQAQHEEEQKRLQYLHQLEIDKAENELVALRNEKLNAEIDYKNSELATSAMHLVQKGELITKMKAELNQVIKVINNDEAVNELKKMIKVLGEDEKVDKDWEHFAQHFDKVHSDFVTKLKEKHPLISANELKLCAYLRMNLSTKEIAQLMNISVRGVEISRYRLRKKLGIGSEINLFEYLIQII